MMVCPGEQTIRHQDEGATSPGVAFDDLAPTYDDTFGAGEIGGRYRRAVWRHLERAFGAGDRVLDLGCGTGEDALHLAGRGVRVVGIDASAEMVEAARRKVCRAGAGDEVQIVRRRIEELAERSFSGRGGPSSEGGPRPFDAVPFDGALSNFGALNCVADLPGVARALGRLVRPGGTVFLCLMGRLVPWEWGWYLLRGRPRTAFRRLAPGGAVWREVRVHYPRSGEVRRAFAGAFEHEESVALGALLPPPYAEGWARRHPELVERLGRAERRLESTFPLPHLADHVLHRLRRR